MRRPALYLLFASLFVTMLSAQLHSQEENETMQTRMNRERLNIGAYILQENAQSERHVKEIADCGLDFMIGIPNNRALLDLFAKHGVGAIVNDVVPGWWGGDGDNAGTLEKERPLHLYDEAADKFQDHPAIWGIDIGDEPSALDFPHYGKIFRTVDRLFPRQFPYLNLYPNYASVAENNATQTVNQLGTTTYDEHIAAYCRNLPSDYICYDYYQYSAGLPGHYENLRVVADACRQSGRSLWIVLQVNSSKPEAWITENQLRFQAFSAMAFGAETIIWACYTAGWWHNQVLDDHGEKTEQYAKLQKVNAELHALGEAYMAFRTASTHFLGFAADDPDMAKLTKTPAETAFSTGVFNDVQAAPGSKFVIGQMAPKRHDGTWALFVCAADDSQDAANKEVALTFRNSGYQLEVHGDAELARMEAGYRLTMRSCGGALLIARPR